MFSFPDEEPSEILIKVVGVGGAGCNAVNTMIEVRPEPGRICRGQYRCASTRTVPRSI